MEATVQPSAGEHLLLAADGFILSGVIWLVINVGVFAVLAPVFGAEEPQVEGVLQLALWAGANILPILGGAVLAWVLHGRRISWLAGAGMVLGLAVGWFVGFALLIGVADVFIRATESFESLRPASGDEPPWLFIGIIAAALVAILAWPVIESILDLRTSRRKHVRVDAVRLASVALIVLLAAVVAPWIGSVYGSEIGEAGAFLAPIAFSGAVAVVGADALTTLADRRRGKTPVIPAAS
jgi:hypothetical protein